eukprot:1908073-Prymnesium_polylepis.1
MHHMLLPPRLPWPDLGRRAGIDVVHLGLARSPDRRCTPRCRRRLLRMGNLLSAAADCCLASSRSTSCLELLASAATSRNLLLQGRVTKNQPFQSRARHRQN